MSLQREENIEVINATYNEQLDIAKLYVSNVDQKKDLVWVMSGKDFDSFLNQMLSSNFSFDKKQRGVLISSVIGKKFKNKVNVELNSLKKEDYNDGERLESFHNVFDKYPFGQVSYEERRKELEE